MHLALPVLLMATCIAGCKKGKEAADDCNAAATTIRQIINKTAIIKITAPGAVPYLVETGSIDGKLIACNLPGSFYQNDLLVTVSGDVKQTTRPVQEPCCSQNFFITRITR